MAAIPEPFRQAMANLVVVIDDWPDPDAMAAMYGDRNELVYGLFEGTPLSERGAADSGELPAMIHLYRCPLQQEWPDPRDLERQVKVTLVHEIGHFMGMDEATIRQLGYE
jgi:predicted Zn-dependent protease with MMP-like domain